MSESYSPLGSDDQETLFSNNNDYESSMKHHHHHQQSFFKSNKFKILLVIIVVVVLVLIAGVILILSKSSSSSHTYNVSAKWDSDFQIDQVEMFANVTGHIWMDTNNTKFKMSIPPTSPFVSLIYKPNAAYTVMTVMGQCSYNITNLPASENPFNNKLTWAYANASSSYIDDKGDKSECDLFSAQEMEGVHITACLVDGEILAFARFTQEEMDLNVTVTFHNFKANALTVTDFDIPNKCKLVSNTTAGESVPSSHKRGLQTLQTFQNWFRL